MTDIKLKKSDSFLCACKLLYSSTVPIENIPSSADYRHIVSIARTYFDAGLYEPLAEYLTETKYNANIWAGYLIIKYGNPDSSLSNRCYKITEHDNRFSH